MSAFCMLAALFLLDGGRAWYILSSVHSWLVHGEEAMNGQDTNTRKTAARAAADRLRARQAELGRLDAEGYSVVRKDDPVVADGFDRRANLAARGCVA